MATVNYTPEPIAEDFILDDRKLTYIVGPVGSAKTTAILMKIVHRAQLQAPSPKDGVRRTRWVIVRNTGQQLRDTTIKSWGTWFPEGAAGKWVGGHGNTFLMKFGDVEAEILFRPLDGPDDVRRVLSLEVTGAIIDEFVEIPREIADALESRCGRYPSKVDGGATWWGMWGASNPGNEDNWWYDWLYKEWEDDPTGAAKKSKLGFYEQPSGFDPRAENIGNLPGGRKYYEETAVGKTEAWIKQYIEVQWGFSLKGKPVYSVFKPEIHVSKRPLQYNPHLPLILAVDPGFANSAALFGQQDKNGRILVLAELIGVKMGARRLCREKIKPLLASRFVNADLQIVLDPAGFSGTPTDEKTVGQVLYEELRVRPRPARSNLLEPRLTAVENRLSVLTDVGAAYLVDPSCAMLIRGFKSGYRYEKIGKAEASVPAKNEYSHIHDANQYLCMMCEYEFERSERRRAALSSNHNVRRPHQYSF